MARRDLTALDAEIHKRVIAGQRRWTDLRHAYPDVARSTFSYRVTVVRERIQQERSEHRAWLADPLQSAKVRRDPYKLFVDLNIEAELQECYALAERLRAQSINKGEIHPYWWNQQMVVKASLLEVSLRMIFVLKDIKNHFSRWNDHVNALARIIGPGSYQRLAYLRSVALGEGALDELVVLVEVLNDAKLIETDRSASRTALRRAIKHRRIAIKKLLDWGRRHLTLESVTELVGKFVDDALERLPEEAHERFGKRAHEMQIEFRAFLADEAKLKAMAKAGSEYARNRS